MIASGKESGCLAGPLPDYFFCASADQVGTLPKLPALLQRKGWRESPNLHLRRGRPQVRSTRGLPPRVMYVAEAAKKHAGRSAWHRRRTQAAACGTYKRGPRAVWRPCRAGICKRLSKQGLQSSCAHDKLATGAPLPSQRMPLIIPGPSAMIPAHCNVLRTAFITNNEDPS